MPRWTQADLEAYEQRRNAKAGRVSPNAVNEQDSRNESVAAEEGKGIDSVRHFVRLKAFRASVLDERNLFDKYFVDALVYAEAIHRDSPKEIEIEVSQELCEPACERVEITITPITP